MLRTLRDPARGARCHSVTTTVATTRLHDAPSRGLSVDTASVRPRWRHRESTVAKCDFGIALHTSARSRAHKPHECGIRQKAHAHRIRTQQKLELLDPNKPGVLCARPYKLSSGTQACTESAGKCCQSHPVQPRAPARLHRWKQHCVTLSATRIDPLNGGASPQGYKFHAGQIAEFF